MIAGSTTAGSMIVPPLQFFTQGVWTQNAFAQYAIERVLNSLPESFLIALFAWILLRILPPQNSRTRFAVWFIALIAVASLPWLPAAAGGNLSSGVTGGLPHPLATAAAHASNKVRVAFINNASVRV